MYIYIYICPIYLQYNIHKYSATLGATEAFTNRFGGNHAMATSHDGPSRARPEPIALMDAIFPSIHIANPKTCRKIENLLK